jgi:uncharacterized membrane protein
MRAGILRMLGFSALDFFALALFAGAWIGYAIALEWSPYGRGGLNARMNGYRDLWMERMLEREVRIVDTQIMASLQNGTAFFASTTLLAIGGSLTLLRSTDDILNVVSSLPFAIQATRVQWEAKAMGLTIIFVYAFFKFAWSYRLFNYVAIMLGATPPCEERQSIEARGHARRTARLCAAAGRHFNRGQRAFFFALGYLGWFVGPSLLIVTTLAIVLVIWRRQFYSDSLRALTEM